MCGITGFWTQNSLDGGLKPVVQRMTDVIAHRGPDDEGHWLDEEAGLALGFRRLAIIDLTDEGHQPMLSPSGRYVLTFNGEIYNFEQLRKQLPDVQWRGHSDTEVILAAVEAWGVREAVSRFNGMFTIALWDRQQRILHLIRDRLGIKPLYYSRQGKTLLWGSELKSFHRHPDFKPDLEPAAVSALIRHGYVPAPISVFKHTYKLWPGSILSLTSPTDQAEPVRFWSMYDAARSGLADPFDGSTGEALDAVESMVRDAVKLRMVADVPLGAFLSGGIDSSIVVSLMQAQSRRPVKTFSIGFTEQIYNEAPFAGAVAKHLGTDHTELCVTPKEAMEVIPRLPILYDEPFADVSQIPTFLVSELARRDVTVSLSGDGGDELFAGYKRYHIGARRWARMERVPRLVREGVHRWGTGLSTRQSARLFTLFKPVVKEMGALGLHEKIRRMATMNGAHDARSYFLRQVSILDRPLLNRAFAETLNGLLDSATAWGDAIPARADVVHQMMYLDAITYLPDDILAKVDRASMGVSLEARVPLLDHRVVELAWRIPTKLKVKDGTGKWILKQLLKRYVPETLFERPKAGFGVPIGAWLREDLRDWAENLLDEGRLRQEGVFDSDAVHAVWKAHLAGTGVWQDHLWRVLMFQAWYDTVKL